MYHITKQNKLLRALLSLSLVLLTIITSTVSLPLQVNAAVLSDINTDFIWPEDPQIESSNYILMDADSGSILIEKGAHEQCYPASVTKLMTALLVVEHCNLNEIITISENAVKSVEYGDATAGLKEGEEFTVEQALYVTLIKSANDMAYALGEYVGGSIANFANMMNEKAAELGCLNTHFSNASGLTDVNHYTTAYDMALITRAVSENPVIMNILAYSKTYSVPPTNKTEDTRYYRLSHALLPDRSYSYDYFLGGKTGYTDAAGHTLSSIAEKDGLKLICIIFRSTDEQRYIDTINLFEYGFNNFKKVYISENESSFSFDGSSMLNSLDFTGAALNNSGNMQISIPAAAYLLMPNALEFGDLSRTVAYRDNTIELYYSYKSTLIGSTKLSIISTNAAAKTNTGNLPYYIEDDDATLNLPVILQKNNYFPINIWLLICAICIIILLIIFIVSRLRKKHTLQFR